MRIPRVYVNANLAPGSSLRLPEPTTHHILRVLRMRVGDEITLFNGKSDEQLTAKIVLAERHRCDVKIILANLVSTESPLQISLVQAVSMGDKMDFTLQKAVELGVHNIIPVYSSRSVPVIRQARLKKRITHWRQVIISASEQSGRTRLATLEMPCDMNELLENSKLPEHSLMLNPRAQTTLTDYTFGGNSVQLWVGPEGGFSDVEIAHATHAGVMPVSFGRRTLRTETAGIAAISWLQARFGDL